MPNRNERNRRSNRKHRQRKKHLPAPVWPLPAAIFRPVELALSCAKILGRYGKDAAP